MPNSDSSGLSEDQQARIAALRAQRQGAASSEVSSGAVAEDQQARIAALRAQRQSGGQAEVGRRSSRKRHVAMGARIAAAGIGASGALGIVAAFGVANASTNEVADEVDAPEEQPSLIVVVHDGDQVYEVDPAQPAPAASREVAADMGSSGLDGAADEYGLLFAALDVVPTPTPIYLAANPVVETIRLQGETIYVEAEVPAPAAAVAVAQAPVEAAQPTASGPDPSLYEQQAAAPVPMQRTQPAVRCSSQGPERAVVSVLTRLQLSSLR